MDSGRTLVGMETFLKISAGKLICAWLKRAMKSNDKILLKCGHDYLDCDIILHDVPIQCNNWRLYHLRR